MGRYKKKFLFILLCIIISLVGHGFFIKNSVLNDQMMATGGDQFSQMIIFKDYLYNQFSNGNFFYDFQYMGGENFFTSLSYYYSTSISFYLSSIITFVLEALGMISNVDLVYWANMILIVSIFRTAIIIFITTRLLTYLNVRPNIALFSSLFYALSPVYFHQTSLWEIFGDGFIWAPLLILGVEKIIREQKGFIFAIAVGLAVFNNGYLAYIVLLMTLFYIGIRFFVHLTTNESSLWLQIKNYAIYGILGLILGSPGFVPFVIGFLKTKRTSGDFTAPLLAFDSEIHNFVFTDEYQVIPVLFILLASFYPIYKNKNVRFFVLITLVGMVARFSPLFGSIMNGFSYPEERWIFLVPLFMSIAIGMSLETIRQGITRQHAIYGAIISLLITTLIYMNSSKMPLTDKPSLLVEYWPFFVIITSLLLILIYLFKNNKIFLPVLLILGGVNLILLYDQNRQLYYDYHLFEIDEAKIINTYQNDSMLITEIINDLENEELSMSKIDFTESPINLALTKDISSYNIYSSFLNGSIQNFITDLKVLDHSEHLNQINGFGGRQSLYSLLGIDTVVSPADHQRIPYGFERTNQQNDYGETYIYENTLELPFIHPVKYLYSKDEANNKNLDELMVDGAVVESEYAQNDGDNRYQINDIQYDISVENGEFDNNKLLPQEESEDTTVSLSFEDSDYDQIAIDYSLIPVDENSTIKYKINGDNIELYGFDKIYSERRPNKIALVENGENAVFIFPTHSEYEFEIKKVYGIGYDGLEQYKNEIENQDYSVDISKGQVKIRFNNLNNYPFMVLPIFNEPGWNLYINGEKSTIIDANFGMIGFEIPKGEVFIELKFEQPFFKLTIFVSALALITLVYLGRRIDRTTIL